MIETLKITLKAARINAGLTQTSVAEAMHVTIGTIVNWESGKTTPKASQFEDLCKLYSMPMEFIILGKT